ncbi:MAG: RidA family protein [Ignavibacteria bacterium]|nr:RidA family protein [Ignavibacteria bacterium]
MKELHKFIYLPEIWTASGEPQAVLSCGTGRMISISAQNALDAQGVIIGLGAFSIQVHEIIRKLNLILNECEAGWSDLLKLTVYIHEDLEEYDAHKEFITIGKKYGEIPAVTYVYVKGFIHSDMLVQLEGIAVVR